MCNIDFITIVVIGLIYIDNRRPEHFHIDWVFYKIQAERQKECGCVVCDASHPHFIHTPNITVQANLQNFVCVHGWTTILKSLSEHVIIMLSINLIPFMKSAPTIRIEECSGRIDTRNNFRPIWISGLRFDFIRIGDILIKV